MSGLAGQLRRMRRAIPQLKNEIAAKVVAVESARFHNDNFRAQAWTESGQKWKPRQNKKSSRAILVKSGRLRRAATTPRVRNHVTDFIMPVYGKMHNTGAGKMPKRQFAGQSVKLKNRMKAKAVKIINARLNRL